MVIICVRVLKEELAMNQILDSDGWFLSYPLLHSHCSYLQFNVSCAQHMLVLLRGDTTGTQLLEDLMLRASEVCAHSDWQVIAGPLSLALSYLFWG